jgi:hypothetical protein
VDVADSRSRLVGPRDHSDLSGRRRRPARTSPSTASGREGTRISTTTAQSERQEATLDDCRAHVDRVFALAERFGVPVDIHADLADDTSDPRFALGEHIADRTHAHGMGGQVTVGHMTSLASLVPVTRKRVLGELADAGVAVVVLPMTDMHLGGRNDEADVRRGTATGCTSAPTPTSSSWRRPPPPRRCSAARTAAS